MSGKSKASANVLPLAGVLRDLAVLRASEIELPDSLLRSEHGMQIRTPSPVTTSVNSSYEYTKAARMAIKLHSSGRVDAEGAKVDDIQKKIEDLLSNL